MYTSCHHSTLESWTEFLLLSHFLLLRLFSPFKFYLHIYYSLSVYSLFLRRKTVPGTPLSRPEGIVVRESRSFDLPLLAWFLFLSSRNYLYQLRTFKLGIYLVSINFHLFLPYFILPLGSGFLFEILNKHILSVIWKWYGIYIAIFTHIFFLGVN